MHSWINPSKVLFTYNLVSNFIYYPNWILKLRYFFNTLSNLQQSKRIYSNYVTISNLQSKTTKYGKLITDQPKTILLGIYDIVSKHLGSKKFTPSFKCLPLKDNPQKWKAEVTLHWPSTIIEEGIATRKRTAEAIAATKAIEWLHENNFLDKNNYPILYQKDEKEKLIQKWKSPYFINITSEVEEKMKCLLNEYETVRKIIENWENELSSHSLFIKDSEDSSNNSSVEVASLKLPFLLETSHNLIDIITGEKFKDYEPEQLLSRSFEMQLEMRAKENNIEYLRMKNLRAHHPISEKRDEILSLIRNNQVIVLSGETGCGKTTQVPQYILEQYTELYEGANCNIVVTQPRRISAISIASRIAEERCEKIYCPNISAIEFLSEALQAPNIESIKYSIRDLQQLDILNENENLTILGKHVACFTTHPRLSKAIIFSSILRCVDPVLTIAAMLTSRNPFDVKLDDNTTIREIKKKYDKDYSSDHLTFVNMYDAWNSIETHEESVEFCELNKINIHNMNFIKGLKTILVEHLCQTGLMKSVTTQDENIYANQYSSNPALILSTLCTGFFPKILKQQTGTLDRGRINWKEISLSTIQGKKARIASTSVLHKKNNLTSPWLIYFSGLQAEERGRLTIRDASVIPGIALIMCAGKQVKMLHQSNENKTAFLTIDDNPKLLFALSSKQGQYLIELRHCFNNLIQWLLCNSDDTSNNEKVKTFINHFLDVFNQLLLQEQQYTKIDQT